MHVWLTALTLQNTEIEAVLYASTGKFSSHFNCISCLKFCTLGLHFTLPDLIIFQYAEI